MRGCKVEGSTPTACSLVGALGEVLAKLLTISIFGEGTEVQLASCSECVGKDEDAALRFKLLGRRSSDRD